ncbi:DNA primase [Candidatus Woesearchaeota archaeon]|nr:DNA primase [Candidatus Woesearchaeota archaeon]
MGKISPVSAKYIVQASIDIDGTVERPDVIGAIFGQTEGLLGSDLELRELQRSGRIGRIDVKTEIKSGKTSGEIIIPSSLDKAETAIIAAAAETIQRIGPCNAKVKIMNIEDVRISKRNYVIERAKELLQTLTEKFMPDSQELTDKVSESVRMMEVMEYGRDRLPAGPLIDESEDIIVVEGRADVLNLLRHGIKNTIALNGTSVPETIIDLSRKKNITLFVDGDRGGELIIKEMMNVAEVDYVCKAPDGKEVEEITNKELHKALRGRIAIEQLKLEGGRQVSNSNSHPQPQIQPHSQQQRIVQERHEKKQNIERSEDFKKLLDDLIGTRGAYVLDDHLNILGKVPVTELPSTLSSLRAGIFAVVLDGTITRDIASIAERVKVQYLIGRDSRVNNSRINVLTQKQLSQ